MKAGMLKHSVVIKQKTITSTGDRGQPVFNFNTVRATVPAQIEELTGRKLEIARQLLSTATHRITIRYLSGLSVTDRIEFESRVFNVGHIIDVGLLHFTQEVYCTEQVGP